MRDETRQVRPDKPMQKVRVMRIWMNSNPGGFSYTFGGPYAFSTYLPSSTSYYLPQGELHPFASLVSGSNVPSLTASNNTVTVTVTPPQATGAFYWEVVLGYLDPHAHDVLSKAFTVHLDEIDFLDDLDSGAPDCGSITNLSDCGEWYMDANLNNVGKTLFTDKEVWDEDNPYSLGVSYQVVGESLRLHVTGYENDDDILTGDDIGQSRADFWNLGSLNTLCCNVTRSLTNPQGNFTIRYRVTPDGQIPQVLPKGDHPFWQSQLADEPNDYLAATSLGVVAVPGPGLPAAVLNHKASLLEAPYTLNGVTLFGNDIDDYRFTLDDFAYVNVSLTGDAGPTVAIEAQDPWFYGLPKWLQDMLGYKGAKLKVQSSGQLGYQPYVLRLTAAYRPLPPDWGEALDSALFIANQGRLVDLRTPDPKTITTPNGKSRRLLLDWAWQHVAGDIDTYRIVLPEGPVLDPNVIIPLPSCEFNQPRRTIIRAKNARIVTNIGLAAEDEIELTGGQIPDEFMVNIEAPSGVKRSVYQLDVSWHDMVLFTPEECENLRKIFSLSKDFIVPYEVVKPSGPPKPPDPTKVDITIPAYMLISVPEGGLDTLVLFAPPTQPVVARLYDLQGVLIAESIEVAVTRSRELANSTGLVAQVELSSKDLMPGQQYVVHVMPSTSSRQETLILGMTGLNE